jgi:ADP-ribosylglycohydrolase
MFLGVCIGDALGQPFEGKSFDIMRTKKKKLYRNGKTTDDTQLTIAVMNALLNSGFDMNAIAEQHVLAYKDTVSGWGSTTREACKRMSEGVPWDKAGNFQGQENRGLGNGVPMKVAPLAAYFQLTENRDYFAKNLVDFTVMTHQTSIAVSSCFAHVAALLECLDKTPQNFDTKAFLIRIISSSYLGRGYFPETLKDDISDRLLSLVDLYNNPNLLYDDAYLVKTYGGGSCYVYDSLPFAYAFFIRSPFKIQSMIDAAYAGGDSDTNASFVGALLGALCGEEIFPDHLKNELDKRDEIVELADCFCDKFTCQNANF